MWGPWRLTLRKAEHALTIGRLDEAVAYVTRPEVRSYRQARELKVRVAEALAGRAEEHLRQGDSGRAWNDIDEAEKLDGAHERLGQLRQELMRRGLAEATQYIKAGQPAAAIECLDRLARRGGNGADARRLHEAAAAWRAAADQARAGRFAQAIEQFEKARGLAPDCEPLENALQQAWAARDRVATLEANLHRAMAGDDWSAALATADEILSIAPVHIQARAARRRAWQAVGAPVSVGGGGRAVGPKFQNDPRVERTVIRPPGSPLADAPHPRPLSPQPGRGEDEFEAPRSPLGGRGVGGGLMKTVSSFHPGFVAPWTAWNANFLCE